MTTNDSADFPIASDHIWSQVLRRPLNTSMRPCLFLDRDGVVVEERHYLHKPDDVALIDGAAEIIGTANRAGIAVVLVTNQSGIARGYFSWADFAATQERILGDLAADGAFVDAVYACPHHDVGNPPYDNPDHPARKPNPGMLTRAREALYLDLSSSWIVGDHATDIGAAYNAGLQGAVHVATGHGLHEGQRGNALAYADKGLNVVIAASIAECAAIIPFLRP